MSHAQDEELISNLLERATLVFEHIIISKALDQAEGSVTRAAELLGMNRQTLVAKLKLPRYAALAAKRSPVVGRKRSIIGVAQEPTRAPVQLYACVKDRMQAERDGGRVPLSKLRQTPCICPACRDAAALVEGRGGAVKAARVSGLTPGGTCRFPRRTLR